jgi:hypothetical protein
MTRVEYDGDNPLGLANEIDAALAKYGLGSDRRMCKAIHFFEGELRLIAECLRRAGPQKVTKQPPGSTHGSGTLSSLKGRRPPRDRCWQAGATHCRRSRLDQA